MREPLLTTWMNLARANFNNRFTRLALLPSILLGVAACSLMIGINGQDNTHLSPKNSAPLLAQTATAGDTAEAPNARVQTLNLVSNDQESADHSSNTGSGDTDASARQGAELIVSTDQPPATLLASNDTEQRFSVALDLNHALENAINRNEADLTSERAFRVERRTVKKGDTLSTIFKDVGLGSSVVHRITNSGSAGKALIKVFPGEELVFELDESEQLTALKHIQSPLREVHFVATDASFNAQEHLRSPEIRRVQKSADVKSSLSEAAYSVGLSPSLTMNMANIFGGVMDFALDVRPSDGFTVIYEEHYLDGEKIEDGNIIAARYINDGKVFNAFRYEHPSGEIGYYNEDGESMRKVFLRAPLDFTRVSSGFNLRRLHPISKKVKPHRGIDYAAPTGTPIFSVGDGRVVSSGYSKANGNFIFIRHGDAYQTKYLHLKKRNVSKGQRVKQGQIIGSVGCTGLCTGPHLHYEFLVNGVHRNPRTIVSKLPKAKKLNKAELSRFASNTRATQDLLHHYGAQSVFALSE